MRAELWFGKLFEAVHIQDQERDVRIVLRKMLRLHVRGKGIVQ
jgi:hypothetical protein